MKKLLILLPFLFSTTGYSFNWINGVYTCDHTTYEMSGISTNILNLSSEAPRYFFMEAEVDDSPKSFAVGGWAQSWDLTANYTHDNGGYYPIHILYTQIVDDVLIENHIRKEMRIDGKIYEVTTMNQAQFDAQGRLAYSFDTRATLNGEALPEKEGHDRFVCIRN